MSPPAVELVSLVYTLLRSLDPDSSNLNATLLQLYAVFGPMLKSALELVDDSQGVTKVSLPSGRAVYQVISIDKRYTLYVDPEFLDNPTVDDELSTIGTNVEGNPLELSVRPARDGGRQDPILEPTSRQPRCIPSRPRSAGRPVDTLRSANTLAKMYCPCQGFTYNTLLGEKTMLCKHLLAVLIAHRLRKEKKSRTGLENVVSLLGFNAEEGQGKAAVTAKE